MQKSTPGVLALCSALLLVVGCGWSDSTEVPPDAWGTANDALPIWNGDLVLNAQYRVSAGGNLMAGFVAQNVGSDGFDGATEGQCYVEMRAYLTPERSGTPFWQDNSEGRGCRQSANLVSLPPGGEANLGPERVLFAVEALPPGTTYFTARVIFSEPGVRSRELPAGEFMRN